MTSSRAGEVSCERDIVYGRARIGFSNPATSALRDLKLDVYAPLGDAAGLRRGLVLAFGGAFHRGSREDDRVEEGEHRNTSIADYCHLLASRGLVCFSIDYRLVPEDPDPGKTWVVQRPESIPTSRVDFVRGLLELPPATPAMLWRGVEAACDDVAMAFRFVRANATRWRLDPDLIAIGGFSAGARSAWNTAYGEGISAAGVVSLSGYMDLLDLERHLTTQSCLAPVLLLRGENDLDYVQDQNPRATSLLRTHGVTCSQAVVGGASHFYCADALASDGSGHLRRVEDVLADFLCRLPRVGYCRK